MALLAAAEINEMVEIVNELANATLLEIASPGPLAANGDPGTPVPVWSGEAVGKLERKQKESVKGNLEVPGKTITFSVYDAVAPADEIAGSRSTGSTVVIRDETRATPVTRRFTVNGTSKETEGTLDSITLELDNESSP